MLAIMLVHSNCFQMHDDSKNTQNSIRIHASVSLVEKTEYHFGY